MKKKVWDITVKDNPNRVVMGENDEFYTTDTEAYLVFKLDDKNFDPTTAVLTLENRNDGSLKNETVDVVDGLIEWEMPQRYIEHFGNWQGQLVYEDTKDGQPELYTSAAFSFVVNAHIGDKKQPSLVEIENWEKFIRDGTELIETWEDMEDLRQANEAQRQANYQELLDTGVLQTNINTKLEQLEEEYAPKLTEVTAQLAQTVKKGQIQKTDYDLSKDINHWNINDFDEETRQTFLDAQGIDVNYVLGENNVKRENLADNAVGYNEAEFILKSKNLLNPAEVMKNTNVSDIGGGLVSSDSYNSSGFIEVLPGEFYTTNDFTYIGFFDSDKKYIERANVNGAVKTRQVPEGCFYIVCSWNLDHTGDMQQINKGQQLSDYDEYNLGIKDELVESIKLSEDNFSKGVVPWESLKLYSDAENLFDYSSYLRGHTISELPEAENGISPSNLSHVTDYITVEPNEEYSFRGFYYIGYYDENQTFIRRENLPSSNHTITIPSDAYYVRLAWRPLRDGGGQQFNEGDTLPDIPTNRIAGRTQTITSLLEYGGIHSSSGIITPANTLDYETERRTGKFLSVVGGTNVKVSCDIGQIAIHEYNAYKHHLVKKPLTSGEETTLLNETTYIKVVVGGVTKEDAVKVDINYRSPSEAEKWSYNVNEPNTTLDTISFVYEAHINMGLDLKDGDLYQEQTRQEKHFSTGVLRLPDNYDSEGEPVRLVLYTGSGGVPTIFASEMVSSSYEDLLGYIKDEGYAIMGANAWTTKYEVPVSTANYGSPTAIASFVSAYNWAIENYNIKKDGVLIISKSAGGYISTILPYGKGIPVLAVAHFAPAINPIARPFGPSEDSKLFYADDFGFEGDYEAVLTENPNHLDQSPELRAIVDANAEKLIGYNGIWNGIVGVPFGDLVNSAYDQDYELIANSARVTSVPQKIWVAEDDRTISRPAIEAYIQSIKNGQSIGELRLLPAGTGDHFATDNHENALRVDVETRLGKHWEGVPLAYAEAVQFFRRFDS